jgi:hypothetical protein
MEKHGKTWEIMGKSMENEGFNGKQHLYIGDFQVPHLIPGGCRGYI